MSQHIPPPLILVFTQILTGTYYSFMLIRHPFDRVLSAYRNRIMDKKTGQAKKHNPKIFKAFQVSSKYLILMSLHYIMNDPSNVMILHFYELSGSKS